MANLLPKATRRAVIWEYRMRVLSVWAFLLVTSFVFVGILCIPSYVYLGLQLKALNEQATQKDIDTSVVQEIESVVAETNALALQLAQPAPVLEMTEVLDALRDAAGPGITIRTFQVARTEKVIAEATVQGSADSREALAEFKRTIERAPLFETAVVPISDLARDVNLPFAITVALNTTIASE